MAGPTLADIRLVLTANAGEIWAKRWVDAKGGT